MRIPAKITPTDSEFSLAMHVIQRTQVCGLLARQAGGHYVAESSIRLLAELARSNWAHYIRAKHSESVKRAIDSIHQAGKLDGDF